MKTFAFATLLLVAGCFGALPVSGEHDAPWHVVERVRVVVDARAGAAGTPGLIGGDGVNISGDGRYVTLLGDPPDPDYPGCDRADFCTLYYRYDRETDTFEPFGIGWDGAFMPSVIFQRPDINHDGRFVVYGQGGLFVRDMMTGDTERVDVDSDGNPAGDRGSIPSISADGRFVSFSSVSDDLVPGDTNACDSVTSCSDVFVRDREASETTRVSVASDGEQGDSASTDAAISANGRFVVFESVASNLTKEGGNASANCPLGPPGEFACRQIFRHDRQTGETVLVSVDTQGGPATGNSDDPDVSEDGRFVSFASAGSDLVPGDLNGFADIFVRDMMTGVTERVSVTSTGEETDAAASQPSISEDGKRVGFASSAENLDPGGPNDCTPICRGIFVHERDDGMTYRVDVNAEGESSNGFSQIPTISGDGYDVVFTTNADNLLPGESGGTYVAEREPTGPPPREIAWGDFNCGGTLDAVDALGELRHVADLPVNQQQPCPGLGSQFDVLQATLRTWGDVDCSGTVDAVDALKLLRHVASLPVNQPKGCPAIGAAVLIPTTP